MAEEEEARRVAAENERLRLQKLAEEEEARRVAAENERLRL